MYFHHLCSQNMQHVIHTYMKHLGVKVKEHRGLEQKRALINFLPRIKVQLHALINPNSSRDKI